MRRILIATDDSTCSLEAVRHGAQMLAPGTCAIRVLSVIPTTVPGSPMPDGQHYHRAAEDAQQALDMALSELTATGHTARGQVCIGVPAAAILEASKEMDADLIIVGTRGPREGSVAEAVCAGATCEVVVVPLRPKAEAC